MTSLRWIALAALPLTTACSSSSTPSGAGSSNDAGTTSTLPDGSADTGPSTSGPSAGLWVGGTYSYTLSSLAAAGAPVGNTGTPPTTGNVASVADSPRRSSRPGARRASRHAPSR